jgi:hypothetical protein
MPETFPILRADGRVGLRSSVPWNFIAPHEAQAMENHEQTLLRLAERGGLDPQEMVAVLDGIREPYMGYDEAEARLAELLKAWEASRG